MGIMVYSIYTINRSYPTMERLLIDSALCWPMSGAFIDLACLGLGLSKVSLAMVNLETFLIMHRRVYLVKPFGKTWRSGGIANLAVYRVYSFRALWLAELRF